ncbi:hypothetical protein N183_27490 [Sinorhizobium sp. Sb3]|uniref:2-dehydro-3-deoxy-D-gluconate 5-dehydrogenase KduD n=1 Tax=Sinorhizobium sp. Sb3 TaxID=1358417 RepID=UPI00071C1F6B|nr:2-dehydro-3-deoxy-D-gluconate 5-dehydrogenase KduD [Sinorhizobium sp. Sb3]KSV71924.1 hypothetical protein N183_27490 [Sinorhizobium sp. Sb3]
MSDPSAFSRVGRRVLVTGANTGIGQGIAVSIGRPGREVVAVGRSSMAETIEKVEAAGGRVVSFACDLVDGEAVKTLIDRVWEKYGPLDGLVNNAGIIRLAASVELSEADWDHVIDLNLKATFVLSQAYARLAYERAGRIVNIGSLLSFQGGIRVASYTASKHGVLGITRILANEWASQGINVDAIAPGYIVFNNTEALRADADRSAAIIDRIPAVRWGIPEDIGDAAVFLLAPASSYMHGAVIPVDGGWLVR